MSAPNPQLPTHLLTAEQFAELPEDPPRELVRGRVVDVCRPTARHGDIAARLTAKIFAFVDEHRLGRVSTGDTGHVTHRDPDTVRGPDVGFVRSARVPDAGVPPGFWEGSPDLAVEIVSPNDRYTEVEAKTRDWLAGGAAEVWLVDPSRNEVKVVEPDRVRVFGSGDMLASAVLEGFSIRIDEIFG